MHKGEAVARRDCRLEPVPPAALSVVWPRHARPAPGATSLAQNGCCYSWLQGGRAISCLRHRAAPELRRQCLLCPLGVAQRRAKCKVLLGEPVPCMNICRSVMVRPGTCRAPERHAKASIEACMSHRADCQDGKAVLGPASTWRQKAAAPQRLASMPHPPERLHCPTVTTTTRDALLYRHSIEPVWCGSNLRSRAGRAGAAAAAAAAAEMVSCPEELPICVTCSLLVIFYHTCNIARGPGRRKSSGSGHDSQRRLSLHVQHSPMRGMVSRDRCNAAGIAVLPVWAIEWPRLQPEARCSQAPLNRRGYVLFLTYQTTRVGGGLEDVWQVPALGFAPAAAAAPAGDLDGKRMRRSLPCRPWRRRSSLRRRRRCSRCCTRRSASCAPPSSSLVRP